MIKVVYCLRRVPLYLDRANSPISIGEENW